MAYQKTIVLFRNKIWLCEKLKFFVSDSTIIHLLGKAGVAGLIDIVNLHISDGALPATPEELASTQ